MTEKRHNPDAIPTNPSVFEMARYWAVCKFRHNKCGAHFVVMFRRADEDDFEGIKDLICKLLGNMRAAYNYDDIGTEDWLFVPFKHLDGAKEFSQTVKDRGFQDVNFYQINSRYTPEKEEATDENAE